MATLMKLKVEMSTSGAGTVHVHNDPWLRGPWGTMHGTAANGCFMSVGMQIEILKLLLQGARRLLAPAGLAGCESCSIRKATLGRVQMSLILVDRYELQLIVGLVVR